MKKLTWLYTSEINLLVRLGLDIAIGFLAVDQLRMQPDLSSTV